MPEQIIDAPLRWTAIAAVAGGSKLSLAPAAAERIERARALVDAIVARRIRCYGVTTGVGALCDVVVDEAQQEELSHNILMSHACGVGEPLPADQTRAIMACAVNQFALGGSGVRPVIVERLLALLNTDLIPLVPRDGSLGYLTYMAHIALVLIGSGQIHGARTGRDVLRVLGLPPLQLKAKEGLSLVNGTADSCGLACIALARLSQLLDWADIAAAMTFENVGHAVSAYSPQALRYRVSAAVDSCARHMTALLEGSALLAHATPRTQDAMSLRAVPIVHGAVRESFDAAAGVLDRELASITDNPIVGGTPEAPVVHSGPYAIASALAQALDALAIATAKIAAMSERRIDRLVNPLVSGLPAFLARTPGVSSGFMIAQCTALSLATETRRLAAPASLDGGVSSGLQEDEIPHTVASALKCLRIIEHLEHILVIELLAAAQAYEFQQHARAPATEAVYRALRTLVAPYADDRPLAEDIATARQLLRRAPPAVAR